MSYKINLSTEEKLKIVKMVKQGQISINHAAESAGISRTTIQRWIAMYESLGATSFLPQQYNMVYSSELKLNAVQDYLRGEGSLIQISKKYKLRSKNQLWKWVKVYNAYGNFNSRKFSGGGSYMKQKRETTLEERIQIVQECIARNKNYGEIALKYHVTYQQVRRWTLRYGQIGKAGLEDRRGKRKWEQTPRTDLEEAQIEIERLKRKLYMVEMENLLLKKWDEIERRDAFRK